MPFKPFRNKVHPNSAGFDGRKFCQIFAKRPVLKLFLIIALNGFVSMAFAAIFIELEAPAQKDRMADKNKIWEALNKLETNLTFQIQ